MTHPDDRPTLAEVEAEERPPSAYMTTSGPRSTCCDAEIECSRVVSDTVMYQPENAYNDDPDMGHVITTLEVRYYGKNYPGESDGYEAKCTRCGADLDVEIEEV